MNLLLFVIKNSLCIRKILTSKSVQNLHVHRCFMNHFIMNRQNGEKLLIPRAND